MLVKKNIEIKGARQNNLKNIDVNIPRDKITVITGVSGSGKSSLAFDIIYGEGQRRFLDSLPTFSRSRIPQLKKPEVDFVFGLSPVIAIEQKRGLVNPRSTVGTMTDIYDYMRLLYATASTAKCPYCGEKYQIKTSGQIVESVLSLPKGTKIEFLTPVHKLYGEDYKYLFDDIRQKGYNNLIIDGNRVDISQEIEIDEYCDHDIKIVIDRFDIVGNIEKNITNSLETALEVMGEHVLIAEILSEDIPQEIKDRFYGSFGCPKHHITMANIQSQYFAFNNMSSSCRNCGGIGTTKKADQRLMVINHDKSINEGAFDPSVYSPKGETTSKHIIMYNLSKHYCFSLDTPFRKLSDEIKDILFYGTKGEKIMMEAPPNIKNRNWLVGRTIQFTGYINQIEHWYREETRKDKVNEVAFEWFKKKMVEYTCPDCGGKKLKRQRFDILIEDKNIHQLCWMQLTELYEFMEKLTFSEDKRYIAEPIVSEIKKRVSLLIEIGLDYLALGRRADTISGGEAQRIRLASQISSGLMGMIYILDEPGVGLHARDSKKVIKILKHLRDIGNTVIVVEHDMETIENADNIVEIGPGPGIHGGEIVETGNIDKIKKSKHSLTGRYLSGKEMIDVPRERRKHNGNKLTVLGARENNLKDIYVDIPLGVFVCISGVSGSGKSTLVNDIIYKKLRSLKDPRIIPGAHRGLEGHEHINDVINIDQSPIGKNSRSNPATYIGLFDTIRMLFTKTEEAVALGYVNTNFSFNSKNSGRCEHCKGDGRIVTKLQFMPDVEIVCPICKGQRYKKEILDVRYKGKNIYEILDMSVEEALEFFKDKKNIHYKLDILNQLGMGYIKLGQSSSTLSGGEAQRIKLASELGKIKSGSNNLYILDEPTTGLHISDIKKLLNCLNLFVDTGHSLLVIEHNLEVLKTADHIIDLGPEGGKNGGYVVAQGTPEEVMEVKESVTGEWLRKVL
ncbi:excinuclease ABC subunit UvrA [Clostridium sp. CF012]|uniref:excinuclease ABC subunit UvrA n=1 Tax=Clostridium sp. CF012 TaxID=2843319 RepID=UPI001C0D7F4D|nr:excinuclease ABC subunit UvrA [Clostridium sp. CF012]MBU3144096.1 excinuclease ABC subunit UvrA [Clostridium sp. CF012]